MNKIKNIKAIEVLDSRGYPTIKTTIELDNGILGSASVPSGSSTGKFEATELRDGDKERYLGKGVLGAIKNVNDIIGPKLIGKKTDDQKSLDSFLIELDGTPQKSKLGANAILSVSLAAAKVEAQNKNLPLYKYLAEISQNKKIELPTPFSVIISGGKHSSSNLDVQEFMVVPSGISIFKEKIRAISEIYAKLGETLKSRNQSSNVGLEGAYGPKLEGGNTEAMDLLVDTVKQCNYDGKIRLALDVASSEFYFEDEESYFLKSQGVSLKRQQLLGLYHDWISNYPILSIEDGLNEEDWDGWKEMTEKFGKKINLVGDDLFVTNPRRIEKGIKGKSANAVLIKVNQIGTLSETLEAIGLCKNVCWEFIISHRSGETTDSFIADLAVGTGANFIKTGAPCRGERVAKYNRLLEIEQELSGK